MNRARISLVVDNDDPGRCTPLAPGQSPSHVWDLGVAYVCLANSRRDVAHDEWSISRREQGYDAPGTLFLQQKIREAEAIFVEEVRRQIMIPAPTVGALRWKEKHGRVGCLLHHNPDLRAVMDRDRARLAEAIERNARAAETRRATCAKRGRP